MDYDLTSRNCREILFLIILFRSGGAQDFELLNLKHNQAELKTITFNARRLLRSRGREDTANTLTSADFQIWDCTNSFSDEFSILYAEVPLDIYESFRIGRVGKKEDFALIAEVFQELGTSIRFIACELKLEITPDAVGLTKLASGEILKLVNEYIGVHGGYLGDFTYRTHLEFYPQFCDVEADPNDYEGTTRERFIKILQDNNNETQAKIIRGVLKKYPVGSEPQRTQQLFDHFNSLANKLRGVTVIPNPDLVTASEVLRRALADAEILIQQSGAVSAVDRIHTALHGYLIVVCDKSGIDHETNPSLTRLFRSLREEHPALAQVGTGSEEIGRVLQACAAIMDALNPLRNKLSVAHPNEQLLGDEEAMLVVNITRTLLHYFDAKFASY
jgi:hypothetical protein